MFLDNYSTFICFRARIIYGGVYIVKEFAVVNGSRNYRAMHYSAQRGIAIACRLSVRSVCNVGGSGSHRLEIWETNCTNN